MKKLDIKTGGHLTSNDDLMLLEAKTNELVEVIFATILKNHQVSYKLYGCQLSSIGNEWRVGPGAIFHQGAFYRVNAQSLPIQAQEIPLGFKIIDNPSSPGTKVIYASGAEVTPHQDKVMHLAYNSFDVAIEALQTFSFKYLTPAHQWQATSLRFELPDGHWGPWVNLRGKQGIQGIQGIPGPNGNTGVRGPKGPKGDKGDDSGLTYRKIDSQGFFSMKPSQGIIEVQFPGGVKGYMFTQYEILQ